MSASDASWQKSSTSSTVQPPSALVASSLLRMWTSVRPTASCAGSESSFDGPTYGRGAARRLPTALRRRVAAAAVRTTEQALVRPMKRPRIPWQSKGRSWCASGCSSVPTAGMPSKRSIGRATSSSARVVAAFAGSAASVPTRAASTRASAHPLSTWRGIMCAIGPLRLRRRRGLREGKDKGPEAWQAQGETYGGSRGAIGMAIGIADRHGRRPARDSLSRPLYAVRTRLARPRARPDSRGRAPLGCPVSGRQPGRVRCGVCGVSDAHALAARATRCYVLNVPVRLVTHPDLRYYRSFLC